MGFFNKLFGKEKNSKIFSNREIIEAGGCPNCWGYHEYDGQYKEYVFDQTKSNINHDKLHQKAFVQQFIETHITGIRLKKDGDKNYCPSCKTKYDHI